MSHSLSAYRCPIDQRPQAFGRLTDSTSRIGSPSALRQGMEADGYLYLKNFVEPQLLSQVRELVVQELTQRKLLARDGAGSLQARPGTDFYGVLAEVGKQDAVLQIARSERLLSLFSQLFGEPARGMDFVWPRAAGPGRGEAPHCDWVYVCRGTRRLMTIWIPLIDIPLRRGPLMILERSHQPNKFTRRYLGMDADRLGLLGGLRLKHGQFIHGGRYSRRPDRVQKEFGTRWLSEDFTAGDVLIFGPEVLHATLDNQTDEFRLSVDTRFQPVSDAKDPRFMGARPEVHARQQKSVFDYYHLSKRWVTGRDTIRRSGLATAYARVMERLSTSRQTD